MPPISHLHMCVPSTGTLQGNENSKLLSSDPELKKRIGGVGSTRRQRHTHTHALVAPGHSSVRECGDLIAETCHACTYARMHACTLACTDAPTRARMHPRLDRLALACADQFAMTEVLGFFISLPLMFYLEGANFGKFISMATTDTVLSYNLVASGMSFYLYNELATMTIKKTSAVTASVANTAKRVIVMVVSAIVFGEVSLRCSARACLAAIRTLCRHMLICISVIRIAPMFR